MSEQAANKRKSPREKESLDFAPSVQRIVVRDLTLTSSIGVTRKERARPQRIRLNLEVEVELSPPRRDRIAEVVNYSELVGRVRETCIGTAAQLLESLAEQVAKACFFDPRVRTVSLRIEKLDRYADVGGIGVAFEYGRRGT